MPRIADPYASTLTSTFLTTGMPASCPKPTVVGSVSTYTGPCRLTGTFKIEGRTVDLTPGTYWITDGNLQLGPGGDTSVLECTLCNGGSLGVTIIFTTTTNASIGTIDIQSAVAQFIGLNAPNSGTYAGLLFVQDTVPGVYSPSATLGRGPSAAFVGDGLVYLPHSDMQFTGKPAAGANGCLILVVNTVTLKGTSQLSSQGCTSAGLSAPTVKTVVLGE
jgi:hypothetical protein